MYGKFELFDTVRIIEDNKIGHIDEINFSHTKKINIEGLLYETQSLRYKTNLGYSTYTEDQLELVGNHMLTSMEFDNLITDINLKHGKKDNFKLLRMMRGDVVDE